MKWMVRFLLVLVALSCGAAFAQRVDMLEWWTTRTPGYYLAPASGANPLYSVTWPGKFWLVKDASGYPWDINLYDSNYVYFWITELNWNDATSFKKFNDGLGTSRSDYSMPMTRRYLTLPSTPQKIDTIKVANSRYESTTQCTTVTAKNLNHVINEVWGPYQEAIPFTDQNGVLHSTLRTLVVSYRYNCDNSYSNCKDKEDFHLAHPYGLVKWVHSVLQNGQYVLANQTTHKSLSAGSVTPVFPCH